MPIEIKKHLDDNTILSLWRITETVEELISQLYLNQEELEFVNKFKNENRKKQWLSYRVLIRNLVKADTIYKIYYNQQGKPYLINPSRNITVTHSNIFSGIMVSTDLEKIMGMDIEQLKPTILKIKHKFLNDTEQQTLSDNPTQENYMTYWCAKEAIYKCFGVPSVSLKDNINIEIFDGNSLIYATVEALGNKYKCELVKECIENYIYCYTRYVCKIKKII